MKVLWFSLSPCGSVTRGTVAKTKHGWMIALETALKQSGSVELEVAFFSKKNEKPFNYDEVRYYPMYIPQPKTKIASLFTRSNNDTIKKELIRSVVQQSKPDIIHIHGTEEAFGYAAVMYPQIPVVFSVQGIIGPIINKFYSGIPKTEMQKFEPLLARAKRGGISDTEKRFSFAAQREAIFLKNAKYIFGRTEWDKNVTLMYNPRRKYIVVNELLRSEVYSHKWKGEIADNKIRLITTISAGIYKGYETLLQTAALLKEYAPFEFEWCVAGYEDGNYWARMSEKYTGYSSSECNIKFLGWQDAESLCRNISNSDIYVQVSHIENSPNALCEAMVIGTPIVASYAGGTSTMLKNGEEGILVQDGDPYAYAGAIIDLVKTPQRAAMMGKNANTKAILRHNDKKILEELLNGYKLILEDFNNNGNK